MASDPRTATRTCPVLVSPYPGVYSRGGVLVGELWRFCQQGTGGKAFCHLHARLRAAGRLEAIPGAVGAFLVLPYSCCSARAAAPPG